ncbi:PIG-L deacetylase family protein [Deinococcus sp.]|uniref:PIG-L deacetylase family protein n=1 Tax=Deinococcus sp. TaxID=47478 RepID=UPI0025E485B1|nr:PIG-L deacetylase family protein [Deinococcus sp.]
MSESAPPLSLLVIGAHPDDCEFGAGGLAALWRRSGQRVTFVSLTNGDAGHHQQGGAPLARRRLGETRAVAERWGLEYLVLDLHDGELEPSLANRKAVLELIRRAVPDLILTHRQHDYHPDHRACAQLVLDAAFLAFVPNAYALSQPLARRPVIAYLHDEFQRPYPFQADLVIDTGAVVGDKAEMLHAHASQVYEWLPFAARRSGPVPEGEAERRAWLQTTYLDADERLVQRYRSQLVARYGEAHAAGVRSAEAFEISEYGPPWSAELEEKLALVLTVRP